MGAASYMLGLAAGFLLCAGASLALGGDYGLYYLIAGGISAGVSVALALFEARRPPKATGTVGA